MRCQEGLYCLTQKHKKGAVQTDSNIFWSNKFQSRCVVWDERSCRRSPSWESIILWSKLRFSKSVPSGTADQKPFKSCLLQWGSSWPGRLSHVGRMSHAHPHGHCGCLVFSIAPWKCRKRWCCAPAQWDSILRALSAMLESQQRNYFGFIPWILSADDLVEAHGCPISLTKKVPTNGFA